MAVPSCVGCRQQRPNVGHLDCSRHLPVLHRLNSLHCGGATFHCHPPYRPQEVASPEHLLSCMDAGGISHALVVHLEPRYAPALEPLIRDLPETRVLIAHLGCPMQGTPVEHDVVIRWSRFPHTLIKGGGQRQQ